VIERIEEMPAGTIGLRASGKLSKSDYTEVLESAHFEGLDLGAVPEDFKTGLRVWVRDHTAWKRFALVTDEEWVARAMHMFTWLTPGEVLISNLDGLEEAKGCAWRSRSAGVRWTRAGVRWPGGPHPQ
jgi:hypothetical protein